MCVKCLEREFLVWVEKNYGGMVFGDILLLCLLWYSYIFKKKIYINFYFDKKYFTRTNFGIHIIITRNTSYYRYTYEPVRTSYMIRIILEIEYLSNIILFYHAGSYNNFYVDFNHISYITS